MEFVNDTIIQARFDYYDTSAIQQQVTLQGGETRDIEDIQLPSNIGVTLFDDGEEIWPTLHGELTDNSNVVGVIQGDDDEPKLSIV